MEIYQKHDITHIAFIMDGNGRWAKNRLLPRHLGHKAGVKKVEDIIDECLNLHIKYVSFYCFSTENWNRPQDEIDHLFKYLEDFFNRKIDEFLAKGIGVVISGEVQGLPLTTQEIVKKACEKTKKCKNLIFNVCLNYGGRREISRICKLFAQDVIDGKKNINELDDKSLSDYLYVKNLPDIDLLIRTSGEQRISNFMLYSLAYSEMIFSDTYWPDYSIKELHDDIEKYMKRNRRFGGIK